MTRFSILLALFLCLSACTQRSAEEELIRSIAPSASWVPALQMTAEKWSGNSVPPAFAHDAAKAARETFELGEKEVAKSRANQDARTRAASALHDAVRLASIVETAAQREDNREIKVAIRDLPRVKAAFDALDKEYGQ